MAYHACRRCYGRVEPPAWPLLHQIHQAPPLCKCEEPLMGNVVAEWENLHLAEDCDGSCE